MLYKQHIQNFITEYLQTHPESSAVYLWSRYQQLYTKNSGPAVRTLFFRTFREMDTDQIIAEGLLLV